MIINILNLVSLVAWIIFLITYSYKRKAEQKGAVPLKYMSSFCYHLAMRFQRRLLLG